MRVQLQGNANAGQFARQLLTLGNGQVTELIRFPDGFCNIVDSMEVLKNSVLPNIQEQFKDPKRLCERAILAPRNNSVISVIHLQIEAQPPTNR